jgi:hypothetical protein
MRRRKKTREKTARKRNEKKRKEKRERIDAHPKCAFSSITSSTPIGLYRTIDGIFSSFSFLSVFFCPKEGKGEKIFFLPLTSLAPTRKVEKLF